MNIFPAKFDRLESALDILSAKHSVIAGNVANVDTPGYTAKEISFKEAFFGALSKSGINMKTSRANHFSGTEMQGTPAAFVKDQVNNMTRNDGNNVNIDNEMLELSKTNIMYDMVARMLARDFESLKYAISEGRRA